MSSPWIARRNGARGAALQHVLVHALAGGPVMRAWHVAERDVAISRVTTPVGASSASAIRMRGGHEARRHELLLQARAELSEAEAFEMELHLTPDEETPLRGAVAVAAACDALTTSTSRG
jgi:hypothetical protein